MNGCYKYDKLLWNLIIYYEYGMDSCVSYAEADGCTLDVLPTHPLGMLRWRQSKMTVKERRMAYRQLGTQLTYVITRSDGLV